MYYWKLWYDDGTWDICKTKIPIRAKDVCHTCIGVSRRSFLWYYWTKLKGAFIR